MRRMLSRFRACISPDKLLGPFNPQLWMNSFFWCTSPMIWNKPPEGRIRDPTCVLRVPNMFYANEPTWCGDIANMIWILSAAQSISESRFMITTIVSPRPGPPSSRGSGSVHCPVSPHLTAYVVSFICQHLLEIFRPRGSADPPRVCLPVYDLLFSDCAVYKHDLR